MDKSQKRVGFPKDTCPGRGIPQPEGSVYPFERGVSWFGGGCVLQISRGEKAQEYTITVRSGGRDPGVSGPGAGLGQSPVRSFIFLFLFSLYCVHIFLLSFDETTKPVLCQILRYFNLLIN